MAVSTKMKDMMGRSSWIRKMFEEGARLKALHGADKVCDFSLGNPNVVPPVKFRNTLLDILNEEIPGKHGYMSNAGYPQVRERLAEYISKEQNVRLEANNLILTCGAGGGMNVVLKSVLNPGDTVLASIPCFMEYGFYVDNHGGKLELVPGKESFDLDVAAMAGRITSSTAAVIINSPNNPSGYVYPEETIRDLGRMLTEKSRETGRAIYLISDEPYRKIVFDGICVPSVFAGYRNTIVITSYSKDLSIPGERIGWAAVHPDAEGRDDLINAMILANRILGFVNAPALMQRAVGRLQGVAIDTGIYERKRDALCQGLAGLGYQFVKPMGTFYLLPRAPGGDDLKFVELLQNELILTVPGRGFALPGYFRIAFCVEDEVIERSMKGFARAREKIG